MMLDLIRKSIRNKYLVLLVLLGLIPLVILGIISNYISSKILENELNKSVYQTLEKASVNIGSMLQRMSDLLSKSNNIIDSIKAYDPADSVGCIKEKRKLNEDLKEASAFLNFPTHIFIIDKNSNVFTNINITSREERDILNRVNASGDFKLLSRYESKVYWLGLRENLIPGYDSEKIYYLARNILYEGEYYGRIYIGTSDYILLRMLNNINASEESKIFVYGQRDEILFVIPETLGNYSNRDINLVRSLLYEKLKPQYIRLFGTDNSITFFTADFNWKIIMITPVKSIRKKLNVINKATLNITLISIFFILLFLFLINRNLVRPIIYLSNLMKIARKGNLDIRSEISLIDEIGVLSDGFNMMIGDFKKMIEKIQADELLKKDLEFKVLQSQINPHFLYNTLNSIRWMAEMNNETKVGDSIVSLVRMLEYNTKGNEKFVNVSDEIQYIREYLDLQSLRYWNRFEAEIDIHEAMCKCKMLKLSLQPIVENCIVHGLPADKRKILIRICGWIDGDKIIFSIWDNGTGIKETDLNELKNRLSQNAASDESKGIGLANVNDRIKLEFGDMYGISVTSVYGSFTEVKMTIPIKSH